MNKKETKIIVSRIEQWYSRMLGYFVEHRTPLSAKYGWSKEAVPFANRNEERLNTVFILAHLASCFEANAEACYIDPETGSKSCE